MKPPFAARISAAMARRNYTLRSFCRAVELDPSFFSKVLAGKRSPPGDEAILRKMAVLLDLEAAELIVSAGRIPSEWRGLWSDPELFSRMNGLASGRPTEPAAKSKPRAVSFPTARPLADELL